MSNADHTLLLALAYALVEQSDADTAERLARLLEAAHPGAEHAIGRETLTAIRRVRRKRRRVS